MQQPTIRFSDVVEAIGATPRALRQWLQHPEVRLNSEQGTGWRNFTYQDVAVLALMRVLIRLGISVPEANRIALGDMTGGIGPIPNADADTIIDWCHDGDIANTLVLYCDGQRVHVSPNWGGSGDWPVGFMPDALISLHLWTIFDRAFLALEKLTEGQAEAAAAQEAAD